MTAATSVPLPDPPAGSVRLLAGSAESGSPAGLADHLARFGPLPTGAGGPVELIDAVDRSGLRGRGGAGFPMSRKLRTVASGRGRPIVVANGCDGDPVTAKDAKLLEFAPHLVIDGVLLACHAVGADEAAICVGDGDAHADSMHAALDARHDENVTIRAVEVPRRYVASEESALVNFLNSGDARPTVTPPRPAERGVGGRPTLVDNVETLAHLALITRFGASWFRAAGTAQSPGTTLVTVGGAVRRPGVYEVELGTPVGAVLAEAGGESEPLQAVQIGGLGGSWMAIRQARALPLAHEDCRAAGAVMGTAALVALPERACGLAETARTLRYLAVESAGQCGPCMFGLPAIADDVDDLVRGADPSGATLDRLHNRLGMIEGRGACAHPDGTTRFAASALRAFADDIADHVAGRPCPWVDAAPWMPVPVPARRGEGER
ncbi:NADH-ubiquinone oxidoreductase-F iron-sulfur binding region domain-containing protein [Pseudonocardia sp. CA-142604]|uniref:NADH-ubiquinone oxidoreductase-F iron-sulfur binding region domain-containing protein n=1 Tax=Pseudonocardia sp. CA-142604 TaxID=3240024 RepID=UPI003D8C5EB5